MPFDLWPHQLAVLPKLTAGNYFLAWEPGCGKTFPVLAAGELVGGRQLYLCPASIRHQIATEAKRIRPRANVDVIRSTSQIPEPEADIVVCSYDMAASKVLWPKLFKLDWGSLVLDEAHMLKNRDAKRTRAVYGARIASPGALFKKAKHVWAMSGTPILNAPQELWTHYSRLFPFATVDPDTGKPLRYRQWEDEFCLKRHTGFGEQIIGGKNLDALRKLISPYVDRKRLEDVIEGIPDRPLVNHIPLDGERLSFADIPEDLLPEIEAAVRGDNLDPLTGLEVHSATLRRRLAMAKAKAVADLVETELAGGAGKVLVFGMHPDALEMVRQHLPIATTNPVIVTGKSTPTERENATRAFQEYGTTRVFIGQITAAGTGLNLQQADRVIFLDAAWTPGANEQAIARAHRAGQTKRVRVSYCSLRGTVDDDIQRALSRKAQTFNTLFN